jgi:4-hydroxy-2-oxoglutarate aldolase
MLLQGIFPPITTPFYPDGNVYFKKLESNVERYSRTPCAGIVVLGSTGEAILLSDQERRDVLKSAREAAAPNKVLIAGTGIESATETLRLTEYAAELGYDVAMVRTPHYYKKQMQPGNILAFYRTVADQSRAGDRIGGASESDRDQGIERRRRKSPYDGGRHATNPAQRHRNRDV